MFTDPNALNDQEYKSQTQEPEEFEIDPYVFRKLIGNDEIE